MKDDFTEVFTENYRNIFNQAKKHLLGDICAAEEITQKVFMQYLRGRENIKGTSKLSVWLYSVCRNECNMLLRKRSRGVNKYLDLRDISDIQEIEYSNTNQFIQPFLSRNLLKSLQDDEKAIAMLIAAGHTAKEVGNTLNITIPAVKSRLHRLRGKLRNDKHIIEIMGVNYKKAANA